MPISYSGVKIVEAPFNQEAAAKNGATWQWYGIALLDTFLAVIAGLISFAAGVPFGKEIAVEDGGIYQQYGKMPLDIFLAIMVSLAFLIFLPFVSLLILLVSGGPIFFKQKRVGKDGEIFTMYKFRTMRSGVATTGVDRFTKRNDSRVIPGGSFLRKTRIDELPQIINILKGEMNVIGPRPERPEIVKELEHVILGYHKRHSVKPGISGWAQVCNGYTDDLPGHIKKFNYDLYYIHHCSFWLNARIILKTFSVIFTGKGT